MKVMKKINNNVAICIDDDNHELIAFGNGIGFHQMPYELRDLSIIWRTYYGVNPSYLHLFNEIPEEIFMISTKIIDLAKKHVVNGMNSNVIFTLADHINFAIERQKKNITLNMPFCYDIQHLYEKEMRVGELALGLIQKELKVHLPKEEAISIALHIINAESIQQNVENEANETQFIEALTELIEQDFSIQLNKKGFNYSRFVTHMQYLLKRSESDIRISSENKRLFTSMKETYAEVYACAEHINSYINTTLHWQLSEEEILYLMLHINRLCSREDCYQ